MLNKRDKIISIVLIVFVLLIICFITVPYVVRHMDNEADSVSSATIGFDYEYALEVVEDDGQRTE